MTGLGEYTIDNSSIKWFNICGVKCIGKTVTMWMCAEVSVMVVKFVIVNDLDLDRLGIGLTILDIADVVIVSVFGINIDDNNK